MTENAVNELLDRYLRGEASLEEKILVERVYQNELSRKQLSGEDLPDQEQKAQMWNTLYTRTHPIRKRTNRSGYFLFGSAAAAVILIVSTLILYSRLSTPAHLQKSIVASHSDIDPGGNNATLTFFNGKRIVLNKVAKGILSVESGVVIKKETEGRLICYAEPTDNLLSQSGQTFYSTLTTPNGGMYQLVLPDGSQVWLNAASALSFPSRFTANERRVTLSGEAYFEIAKDKKRPFKVETGKQVVEVLGTHFNINAYGDEGFYKTTLLEGSVKILSSTDSVIIKPGEQAKIFPQTKQKIKVEPGDTEEAIAWKNNTIMFNSRPLKEIMNQISRWYNVEVLYQGDISNKVFTGSISRYAKVSQVLKILETTGLVNFKIEGRRITVMP